MATKIATSTKAPKAKASPAVEANGQRQLKWTDRRMAVVKAMRQLKATSASVARPLSDIAEVAAKLCTELADSSEYCGRPHKGKYLVGCALDQYKNELIPEFAASCQLEGVRGLSYYLTPAGKAIKF